MCQAKKIDAAPSIGGPSAAMTAPSPRKKTAVRQRGHPPHAHRVQDRSKDAEDDGD